MRKVQNKVLMVNNFRTKAIKENIYEFTNWIGTLS